jgi:hypothetical protein
MLLERNSITGSRGRGISLDGTGYTTLAQLRLNANAVKNIDFIGIDVIAADGVDFNDNDIDQCSLSSPTVHAGIRLASDGTTSVKNVNFHGNSSTGSSSRSALSINATAPLPTNVVIGINHFPVCGFAAVETNGALVTDLSALGSGVTPTAGAVTSTHSLPILVKGVPFKVGLTAA